MPGKTGGKTVTIAHVSTVLASSLPRRGCSIDASHLVRCTFGCPPRLEVDCPSSDGARRYHVTTRRTPRGMVERGGDIVIGRSPCPLFRETAPVFLLHCPCSASLLLALGKPAQDLVGDSSCRRRRGGVGPSDEFLFLLMRGGCGRRKWLQKFPKPV